MFKVVLHMLKKIKGEILLLFLASVSVLTLALLSFYVMPEITERIFGYFYSFIPKYIVESQENKGNVKVFKDFFEVYDADNKFITKETIYFISVNVIPPKLKLQNTTCTVKNLDLYGESVYVSLSGCKIIKDKIELFGVDCERDFGNEFYCDLCSSNREKIKKFLKGVEKVLYSSFKMGKYISFPLEITTDNEFYCEVMNDPWIRRFYTKLKYLSDFIFKDNYAFSSKNIFVQSAESNISGYRVKLVSEKVSKELYLVSYLDLNLNNESPKSEIFRGFVILKRKDFNEGKDFKFTYEDTQGVKNPWAKRSDIAGGIYTLVNLSGIVFRIAGIGFILLLIVAYAYIFSFIDKKLSQHMELLSYYGKKPKIKLYVSLTVLTLSFLLSLAILYLLINYFINSVLEDYLLPPIIL